jgi:hypothetical protein
MGLLITVSATPILGIYGTSEKMNNIPSIGVVNYDTDDVHTFATEGKHLDVQLKPVARPISNVPVADTEEDEVRPTIARGSGQFLAGYIGVISILEQHIYLATSTDGSSFNPEGRIEFENVRADYPDFDHWGDTQFKGTFFADIPWNYLLEFDINDLSNIGAIYWNWEDDGWSDFRPIEIDCHNSQNTWEYGMMCTVATTTYGQDQGWDGADMPHMFFRSPDEENTGYISWQTFEGCEHSSCCIDKTADMMWSAFDCYNETSGSWNIVVWGRDFSDPLADGATRVFAEITSSFNAEYPTIAADNDNIVIICHGDENTNSDIVCFYSTDGGYNWDTSNIANSPDDEQFPDAVSTGGAGAGCVFTMNGDLYYVSTENGGASWSTPAKLNDGGNNVVEEYRTAFIETGSTVWSDTRNGNPDIFYEVTEILPDINVQSISGGIGVSAIIENSGTGVATNVQWSIDLEGGLIIIGRHADDTIPSLDPGASVTVRIPLVLGIGGVTIKAEANGSTKTASGTVLLILVTNVT